MKSRFTKVNVLLKKKKKAKFSFIPEAWCRDFDEAMANFAPFEAHPHIAASCSGGADSLALVFLLQDWALRYGARITAVIVNHGLREESANQAVDTQKLLAEFGIKSKILTLPNDLIGGSNIQAGARKERYRKLCDWCLENGVLHLCLGHHRGDAVETFFERLRRGSGIEGLSGMAKMRFLPECRLLRPLLSFDGVEIRNILTRAKIDFIKDPSNEAERFLRTRLRRFSAISQSYGFSPQRIELAMSHLERASLIFEDNMAMMIAEHVRFYPEGYAEMRLDVLGSLFEEQAMRLLAALLAFISGKSFRPRYQQLRRILEKLRNHQSGMDVCLSGCRLNVTQRKIFFFRHHHGIFRQTLCLEKHVKWDGRYDIFFKKPLKNFQLGGLGKKGVREAFQLGWGKQLHQLPHPVRLTLPALWYREKLYEVILDSASDVSVVKKIDFSPNFRLGFSSPPSLLKKKT